MKRFLLCLLLVFLTGCAASTPEPVPQPSCGPDGPPWVLHNINTLKDLRGFLDSAEMLETGEQWIEENWNGSWGMLSGFEDMSALAAELTALPYPSIAEETGVDLQVLPDYGRDYVKIDYENEEVRCIIFIHMNAEYDKAEVQGRPVRAKNFQKLFDQTKSSRQQNGNSIRCRYYEGKVDGYWISFYVMGYNRKEAQEFLRSLEFKYLSDRE